MKKRFTIIIATLIIALVLPNVATACSWWECQYGPDFAHCYEYLSDPHDSSVPYTTYCDEYHECMLGGGCKYYCMYREFCFEV